MRSVLSLGVVVFLVSVVSTAHAAATVTVEQIYYDDAGTWTLYTQDGTPYHSSQHPHPRSATVTIAQLGQATLSIAPPPGATANMSVYRGTQLENSGQMQQVSFTLSDTDAMRIVVHYVFDKFGLLGVTTDPSKVPFRVDGPAGKKYTAVTPHSFKNLPIGQYTVTVGETAQCYSPPKKTVVVEKDKRVAVNIKLQCTKTLAKREARRPKDKRPTQRSLRRALDQREHQAAREKLR